MRKLLYGSSASLIAVFLLCFFLPSSASAQAATVSSGSSAGSSFTTNVTVKAGETKEFTDSDGKKKTVSAKAGQIKVELFWKTVAAATEVNPHATKDVLDHIEVTYERGAEGDVGGCGPKDKVTISDNNSGIVDGKDCKNIAINGKNNKIKVTGSGNVATFEPSSSGNTVYFQVGNNTIGGGKNNTTKATH